MAILPKTGWAFFIAPDGTPALAIDAPAVFYVERAGAGETAAEALARVRADPGVPRYSRGQVQNVVALSTGGGGTGGGGGTNTTTAIRSTTSSATRPATLNRIGITRDKTTRETRLMFDNQGGAAALRWIVTDAAGQRIPGAGWVDQALYQPGLTDFLPYVGYSSSARLSPAVEGVLGLIEGVTYLVGADITVGGVTEWVVVAFTVPTQSTPTEPVELPLPPLSGTTGNTGGGAGDPEAAYTAEDYPADQTDQPLTGTDSFNNPIQS